MAEKSRVCRSRGSAATMRLTLGQKPMSSMRSASSSTRTFTSARLRWPCSMRSSRRPGVATRRSQPASSLRICRSSFAPPITTTAVWPVCSHTTETTSSICCASSRVGVTTSANGPNGWALWFGARLASLLRPRLRERRRFLPSALRLASDLWALAVLRLADDFPPRLAPDFGLSASAACEPSASRAPSCESASGLVAALWWRRRGRRVGRMLPSASTLAETEALPSGASSASTSGPS